MTTASAVVPQPITDRQRITAIITASVGNLIEWFDFYIYAFTAIYFASSFFPDSDPTVQLLNVAGIYAAGFLIRPLGGWYFGRYADRRGRQAAIVFSILLMGVGSLIMVVLPTYSQIGVWAPALLLGARLLQGFSTGGQYGAAATYLSEIASDARRGFYASFLFVTLIGGQLLALLVLLVLQHTLEDEAIRSWGWRLPFVLGTVLALLMLVLRRHMHETVAPGAPNAEAGSVAGLLRHPKALLIVMSMTAGGAVCIYTFTTYMQKFLVNTAGMDLKTVSVVMTVAIICFMALQPLIGALSDRIGRRRCLLIFSGLMTVCVVPLMSALTTVGSAWGALILVFSLLVILSFYTSISGLFKAELFPPHIRALGVGLGHSISAAIFGGTAEFFALLFKRAGHESLFFWYVALICLISFITALRMREPRRVDMMK